MLGQYFQQIGRPDEFKCPDLPHRPAAAMGMLESLLEGHAPEAVKLVGSSLGGWYATVLAERLGVRAVLVNPAVHPAGLLASAVGEHTHYSTGERYQFTAMHVQELADMELTAITHPERLMVLLETGDEVLDYRTAQTFYRSCRQVVVQGGNHSFNSFAAHIPEIIAF